MLYTLNFRKLFEAILMALSRRQKISIIPVLLYWPTIFILTHMPVPRLIFRTVRASDKILHFIAYFVLVFLLWFAVSPGKKVSWRRAAVWWVLLVVIWYGVFDEWLQGYVGRNPDVMDFFANLAGTLTCLVLLSIFSFWCVSLIVTGVIIFVLTNPVWSNTAALLPAVDAMIHLFSYALFSILWVRGMQRFLPVRASQVRWLMVALAGPTGFLLLVESLSVISGRGFGLLGAVISLTGIAVVVAVIFVTALFRRKWA